jgi:hypothetical protein
MKSFSVEVITDRNDRGDTTDFKREKAARAFAIKASMTPGVLETFLRGEDDTDFDFEVMEYYTAGKLTIKVA